MQLGLVKTEVLLQGQDALPLGEELLQSWVHFTPLEMVVASAETPNLGTKVSITLF